MAELTKEVFSVERLEPLAGRAQNLLTKLGYKNIYVCVSDGTLGWPTDRQFDAIMVTAASPSVPQVLLKQLKNHGRMVIPVGPKSGQKLTLITKTDLMIREQEICSCVFVPLVGKFGWS